MRRTASSSSEFTKVHEQTVAECREEHNQPTNEVSASLNQGSSLPQRSNLLERGLAQHNPTHVQRAILRCLILRSLLRRCCAELTFVSYACGKVARMFVIQIHTTLHLWLILNLASLLRKMRPERDRGGNLPLYSFEEAVLTKVFSEPEVTDRSFQSFLTCCDAAFHVVTDLASMFTVQKISRRPIRAK